MNPVLVALSVLFLSTFLHAAVEPEKELLFRCQKDFSIFTRDFQQGDESEALVYYHPKTQSISVDVIQGLTDEFELFSNKKMARFYYTQENSAFYAEWSSLPEQSRANNSYISMVNLAPMHWAIAIHLSAMDEKTKEDFRNPDEMRCRELPAFEKYMVKNHL